MTAVPAQPASPAERFRQLPPNVAALMAANGYRISQIVYVAASLEIADRLAGGTTTVAGLAEACGADPRSLYRLLRAAASLGIFFEEGDGRFRNTELSEALRTDARPSLRATALMLGQDWHWAIWGEAPEAVRSGTPAFPRLFGTDWRSYRAAHPDLARSFRAAIEAVLALDVDVVLSLFDFGAYPMLLYVGFDGGYATFLGKLLRANRTQRALVLELPEYAELGRDELAEEEVVDRVDVLSQEPFRAFPPGAGAHVFRHSLAHYDDRTALRLLRSSNSALPENGRLVVVGTIVPPRNEFGLAKLIDLEGMLMSQGGRERTEEELRGLLKAARFRAVRRSDGPSPTSVLEAVKV